MGVLWLFFLHHAKCYKADGRDREDVVQCEMLSYYIWRRGKFDFGKFSLHSVSNLHDAACPAADLFIFSSMIFYDPDRLTTCDSWDGLKLPPLLQSWVGLVVKKKGCIDGWMIYYSWIWHVRQCAGNVQNSYVSSGVDDRSCMCLFAHMWVYGVRLDFWTPAFFELELQGIKA